jgi:hypothetical protein
MYEEKTRRKKTFSTDASPVMIPTASLAMKRRPGRAGCVSICAFVPAAASVFVLCTKEAGRKGGTYLGARPALAPSSSP